MASHKTRWFSGILPMTVSVIEPKRKTRIATINVCECQKSINKHKKAFDISNDNNNIFKGLLVIKSNYLAYNATAVVTLIATQLTNVNATIQLRYEHV